MGANAQTTVQKFLSGAVLTAEQQNTSAATGVPVFATTVTRDAAFGGANKVLAEGQTCYLEDSDVVQVYKGSAWTPSSGLTFITGASFPAVQSFSLPADTFTSTYANYRIVVNRTAASGNLLMSWRGRAGGVDESSAQYLSAHIGCDWGGSTAIFVGQSGWGTSAPFGRTDTADIGGWVMDIIAPKLSGFTKTMEISMGGQSGAAAMSGASVFYATNSFDSMTFLLPSGTFTGSYRVYGYANS